MSIRHISDGSQPNPPSISTTRSVGKLLEDALDDQADHLRLEGLRHRRVVLHVERGPAGRRERVAAAAAAEVDPDRQAVAHRRLEDRPVPPAAERLVGADEQQHLHEARVRGGPVDLLGGQFGVLVGHDDARPQPRLLLEPLRDLPLVDRAAERRRVAGVLLTARRGQAVEHAEMHVVGVEVLFAQETQVGAGRQARRRPRVGAGRPRRALGVGGADRRRGRRRCWS